MPRLYVCQQPPSYSSSLSSATSARLSNRSDGNELALKNSRRSFALLASEDVAFDALLAALVITLLLDSSELRDLVRLSEAFCGCHEGMEDTDWDR